MQGGTIDLNVMNASLLAGNVKEMAVLDFPYPVQQRRGGRRDHRRPRRQEADRQAAREGPCRARLLGPRLPRRCTRRSKPIAKADDLRGLKMRVIPTPIYVDFMNADRRQRRADAVHRDLHGARAGRDRRHDQPAAQHPGRQVQRGLQAPHADQPHVHAADRDRQQADLGQAVRGGAQDPARGRDRDDHVPAQGRAGRGRQGARPAQEGRHDGPRAAAGGSRQAAREGEAGDRRSTPRTSARSSWRSSRPRSRRCGRRSKLPTARWRVPCGK